MSGLFIQNLLNKSLASLIDFIQNDHECTVRFCLSYEFEKWVSIAFKLDSFSTKKCIVVMEAVMTLQVPTQ